MKSPFTFTKTVKDAVSAIWPNRAVRRALKYNRMLPTEWEIFFTQNPKHRALAKAQG